MSAPSAFGPFSTLAERPAPDSDERLVFVRDHNGGAKRIPLTSADALISRGLADRVSAAGHVRLKLGFRIDKIDLHRGAVASVTTSGHRQESKQHHPRCDEWRQPA